MKTRYIDLRNALRDAGITHLEVAKALGISETSMSFRFSGRYPFTLAEAYVILDLLGRPYSDLPRLFPKDGIAANAPADPAQSALVWLEAYADDIKRTVDVRLQMAKAAMAEPLPAPIPIRR